jgi:putative DNA modification/repair radical SAM protein
VPRARFTVDEVVQLTLDFYRRNLIEGLFLSSGIIRTPDYTMEQVVEVARVLREDHDFRGYIHLKTIPDASAELLARAGRHADRLSINLELPTPEGLQKLAPEKNAPGIRRSMARMHWLIDESKAAARSRAPRAGAGLAPAAVTPPRFAPAGQSTQMIVGATPSTDADVLLTADTLYRKHRLRRVYYSAYSPIPHADGRLPSSTPPLVREHRLYQADWLIRFYGFDVAEITTPADPNLDLKIDPKLAWALRSRHRFPVDLNRAPRDLMLRVPGLGARNVDRLILIRRHRKIRLDDLAKLRTPMTKVKPWVLTDDFNPDALRLDRDDLRDRIVRPARQLELFETVVSARTGEL